MIPILTVFVKATYQSPSYFEMLEKKFGKRAEIVRIRENEEVNNYPKKSRWYILLNEGEMFDDGLLKMVPSVITSGHYQYYLCFKKSIREQKFWVRPFMFRDFVKLNNDNINPVSQLLTHDRLLGGWVYDC